MPIPEVPQGQPELDPDLIAQFKEAQERMRRPSPEEDQYAMVQEMLRHRAELYLSDLSEKLGAPNLPEDMQKVVGAFHNRFSSDDAALLFGVTQVGDRRVDLVSTIPLLRDFRGTLEEDFDFTGRIQASSKKRRITISPKDGYQIRMSQENLKFRVIKNGASDTHTQTDPSQLADAMVESYTEKNSIVVISFTSTIIGDWNYGRDMRSGPYTLLAGGILRDKPKV